VRPVPGGPNLTDWLKRVTFTLHETFANPVRSVESVNPSTGGFELQETAYGGFLIIVKLYFQQYATEKQQQRQHYLLLEPVTTETDPVKAVAEREKLWKQGGGICRAETVEVIEFNEPTELLFDALTSDTQWNYLQPKSKGKGRSGYSAADTEDKIIGEPPASADAGSLWSKGHEDSLVEMLKKMGDTCDEQLKKTLERSMELNKANAKMKEGAAIDEQLLQLYESLPPKKK
jgi:YEATS domain-containing protein 4